MVNFRGFLANRNSDCCGASAVFSASKDMFEDLHGKQLPSEDNIKEHFISPLYTWLMDKATGRYNFYLLKCIEFFRQIFLISFCT